jgi:hypothetical protein
MTSTAWYWCLEHSRVEPEDASCPPDRRLGPFPTEEAAADWKATFRARNEAWDRADAEWEGVDPGDV